jgi:ribonuclease E
MVGNIYLGRVQNVLPSMEAAFVDIGKGRNAVLYAGEVNWDAAGLEVNQAKRIENALSSGDTVLVQVTKDPIGHKGARLTSQISLPGRYLVYVPEGSMTGISRKLPDTERARLKGSSRSRPDSAGVIVRTAAEGASEEELRADVERLTKAWEKISQSREGVGQEGRLRRGPHALHGEPDLTVRVIRDIFNEDFSSLVVSGDRAWSEVSDYVEDVAPDLAQRLSHWTSEEDLFTYHRVQEQIAKAMDRKVWLPSGGSLVIDRTEAMTVVDVNTGKFVGSGGNLEETVTKNNIEAAEEIVRQLRLRDIGGIIVIDFIDMVLESNRDLVVRRLLECLGRDRTKHQVAEVTSLGLVQMTRKRVGSGLIEVFSESCEHCSGRGIIVHAEPIDKRGDSGPVQTPGAGSGSRGRARGRSDSGANGSGGAGSGTTEAARKPSGPTAAQIAAAAHAAAVMTAAPAPVADSQDIPAEEVHEVDGDEHVSPSIDEQRGSVDASEALEVTPALAVDAEPAQASPDVVDTADDVAEAVAEAVAHDLETPVVRPKRRRGRVVAPAGPPAGDLAAPTASP